MSSTLLKIESNLLDKIYPYLRAIVNCTGSNPAIYKNVPESCKSTIDAYLDNSNYLNTTNNFIKSGQLPVEFIEAFMAVLANLTIVDPNRKSNNWDTKPLNAALKAIVYKEEDKDTTKPITAEDVAKATQVGGGEELNKIIKLSKSEVSGFVPYHVNNIAGSYTEEYLNTLNSKIRKIDSQFGGFKKVTKEVIGSIEDLDRILRTELENQIDVSVFKRYYKTYPIMSQKGGSEKINEVWNWYKQTATEEQREVFDAYMEFVQEDAEAFTLSSGTNTRTGSYPLKFNSTPDKKKFLRINLKKSGDTAGYDTTGKPRSYPLILLTLPPNALSALGITYWFSSKGSGAAVTTAAGLKDLITGAGGSRADDIINLDADNLEGKMSCDDKILKKIINEGPSVNEDDDDINPFATGDYNKYFKESGQIGPGLLKNGWRWDRSTNTVQRKEKGKWVDYNPIENPDEFKKIFNSAGKCFNSFIEFKNKEQCCQLIEILAEGNSDRFFEEVKKGDFTVQQLDTNFDNVNPITVVKLLEGFKFQKQKTWVPVHGNVYKFPNWTWWSRNVIDASDLTSTEKEKIKTKLNLREVLEMSVAFVNNNLNLLNPHITYDNTGLNSGTPDKKLEEYNVQRYMLPGVSSNPYDRFWWSKAKRQIEKASLPHHRSIPFFPLLGGQQFVLSGGSDNKKTEIVLDTTDIVPQFATQIRDDLKLLVENLKSKNKTLSPKEMEKLNKELEDFRKSEVNLINKVLLINKYLKISNLLPENEREYITENKMTKLISDYYENFKDYADKDLELKGIGSYLRSILSNDNL